MKKFIALLVAFTFLSSFLSTPALAVVKAGAKCAIMGQNKIFQERKFTCIKVGKKFLWDKGVTSPTKKAFSAPTTTQSASPEVVDMSSIPTTTQSASPEVVDNKWYAWSFRYTAAGILERSSDQFTWSSVATRKGQVLDPIRVKAFEEISKYTSTANATKIPLNIYFYYGLSVQPDVVVAYQKYFDISLKFFENRIPKDTVLDVVIGTELDDEFFKATYLKSLGSTSAADELFEGKKSFIHQFDGPNGKSSSGGGTVDQINLSANNTTKIKFIYTGVVCSCAKAETLLMYNVAHEVTHFYQFAVTPTTRKQNFIGQWPNVTEGKIYMPASLLEGSANTLGSALIVPYAGWYSDQMNWHLGRSKRTSTLQNIDSESQAIELMKIARSHLIDQAKFPELELGLGQLVWEYFIAKYGIDAYFTLFETLEKMQDFDVAIKQSINLSENNFYTEAAAYVIRSYNAVTS